MAITSISGQAPTLPATNVPGNRPATVPDEDEALRAANAAEQGTGARAVDTTRGVNNTTRSDAVRERNRKEEPSAEQVKTAVEQLNDFVKTSASNLQFSIDKESGMRIIKVVDPETKDVIRQIPTEEAVEIAKAIGKLQGLLIRQTA